MDQSVCSSNVWSADESSTNRSDLHKHQQIISDTNTTTLFIFLSKSREKHQVYRHILKVDESPHFYSGTPLKYVHMIHSPNISSFFCTGPLLSSSVHPLLETTSYSFCSLKIAYFILIGQLLEAYWRAAVLFLEQYFGSQRLYIYVPDAR